MSERRGHALACWCFTLLLVVACACPGAAEVSYSTRDRSSDPGYCLLQKATVGSKTSLLTASSEAGEEDCGPHCEGTCFGGVCLYSDLDVGRPGKQASGREREQPAFSESLPASGWGQATTPEAVAESDAAAASTAGGDGSLLEREEASWQQSLGVALLDAVPQRPSIALLDSTPRSVQRYPIGASRVPAGVGVDATRLELAEADVMRLSDDNSRLRRELESWHRTGEQVASREARMIRLLEEHQLDPSMFDASARPPAAVLKPSVAATAATSAAVAAEALASQLPPPTAAPASASATAAAGAAAAAAEAEEEARREGPAPPAVRLVEVDKHIEQAASSTADAEKHDGAISKTSAEAQAGESKRGEAASADKAGATRQGGTDKGSSLLSRWNQLRLNPPHVRYAIIFCFAVACSMMIVGFFARQMKLSTYGEAAGIAKGRRAAAGAPKRGAAGVGGILQRLGLAAPSSGFAEIAELQLGHLNGALVRGDLRIVVSPGNRGRPVRTRAGVPVDGEGRMEVVGGRGDGRGSSGRQPQKQTSLCWTPGDGAYLSFADVVIVPVEEGDGPCVFSVYDCDGLMDDRIATVAVSPQELLSMARQRRQYFCLDLVPERRRQCLEFEEPSAAAAAPYLALRLREVSADAVRDSTGQPPLQQRPTGLTR
mmetsp:Transcript_36527/g.117241  ORF Transcript_36527/g.117241 Transcript_36527/m.117241 type:complete len:660 (-) Transcript_36527:53-2032(-)